MEINLKTDSRKVKKGDIFVALRCANNDGHDYIKDAINNGASCIFVDTDYYKKNYSDINNCKNLFRIVNNTHDILIDHLKTYYYDIIKNINLIGITGTNGKTTSAYLTYQGLNMLGEKTAYIGTIGAYIGNEIIEINNTTPDIIDIYNLLLKCQEQKIKNVVMEVSSHALSLNRVAGLEFDIAIFTNLTQDHLDYHGDIKSYAYTKSQLFDMIKHNGIAIINNDSDYKELMIKKQNHNITYGFSESDFQLTSYEVTKTGTNFVYKENNDFHKIQSTLLGKHNVYNLLTMIILLKIHNYTDKEIAKIIPEIKAPKGRMEKIDYGDSTIIVDYAHTPDAIVNTLNTVREFSKRKIYSIIGCGGNRDRTKRELMAEVSCNLSDIAIFTSDNPRLENPLSIIDDMICSLNNQNYIVYPDRKCAIKHGINLLKPEDTLVVMGKGHENYQIIGTEKIYHDDVEFVKQLIKKR